MSGTNRLSSKISVYYIIGYNIIKIYYKLNFDKRLKIVFITVSEVWKGEIKTTLYNII